MGGKLHVTDKFIDRLWSGKNFGGHPPGYRLHDGGWSHGLTDATAPPTKIHLCDSHTKSSDRIKGDQILFKLCFVCYSLIVRVSVKFFFNNRCH